MLTEKPSRKRFRPILQRSVGKPLTIKLPPVTEAALRERVEADKNSNISYLVAIALNKYLRIEEADSD